MTAAPAQRGDARNRPARFAGEHPRSRPRQAAGTGRRLPAPIIWLAGLLAVYLIAPFIAGTAQLGTADWSTVDWSGLGQASFVSLVSATLATIGVTVCGIPLGYLLARRPSRGSAALGFLVQLPLALPPLASGILLLFLFGYSSPIGRWTGGALTDSLAGIVAAQAFVSAPFLIIAARSAFAAIDPVLEDVGATLGHRPLTVFQRVSLPLAWQAITAGMLLTWLRGFGEFGATVLVAYHPYSLPVYTYVAFGSEGLPAMLPVLLPTLGSAVIVLAAAAGLQAIRPVAKQRAAATPSAPRSLPVAASAPIDFEFRRELEGFTLDVAWRTATRRLAVLGESGSGKSMMLRLIAGLDTTPNGRLILGRKDLSAAPAWERRIGYVPQNYGLMPHLPLHRQLSFATDSDAGEARRWIERLGLTGLEDRLPDELSLGQQQRVALARAFSRPTGLLLLDEPFSALDAPLRSRLRAELRALQAEIQATTILVTHDPEEAFLLADELLILQNGRVLQVGEREAVYTRPASEAAARLLGARNIGTGRVVASDRIDIGAGRPLVVTGPKLQVGAHVGWSVRPDRIRIAAEGPYCGTITAVGEVIGGRRSISLRLGDAAFSALADPGQVVRPGPCGAVIDPLAVQVWPLEARSTPWVHDTPASSLAERVS